MLNVLATRSLILFLSLSLASPTASFAWKPGQDNSKSICSDRGFANAEGQALAYCKAIDSAEQAQRGLRDVVLLDTAAAGICWAEYIASKTPGGMTVTGLCGGAALAAGSLELYHTLDVLKRNNQAGDYKVDSMGEVSERKNGSDIMRVALGAGVGIEGLRIAACYYGINNPLCKDKTTYINSAKTVTTSTARAEAGRQQLALEAALIFTALGATRGVNLMNTKATIRNAEEALTLLNSSAAVAGTGGAASGPRAVTAGYGSVDSTASSSGPTMLEAIAAPESLLMPRNSPLAKKAAEIASRIPHSALNSGTGALAAKIASGLGAGGDTSGLTSTASKIEAYMASLPGASQGTYAAGGGGNLVGGKSVSDSANLNLGAMFGQNGAQQAEGPEGQIGFRSPASAHDIWHSNTDQNLFQIVSGKYEVVTPRIK